MDQDSPPHTTVEETRRRLLAAADELFRQQGCPATSVAAIAARADVSLQTLYLAWGSKSALLRAATNAAAVAAELPMTHEEWRASIRTELDGEPAAGAQLAAVSRIFVRVAERTAPYWRMQREAGVTDPEIAADWRLIMAQGRRTMAQVAGGLPADGLRPDITLEYVTDTLRAVASPDVYLLLTADGGYGPAAFEAWLRRTLTAALCSD